MANRKVTLVKLCKTESGWRRYPAVIGRNGRVKPGQVFVGGEERHYPEGKYQLRMYEGSRMIYKDAGEHAAEAMAARQRAEHLLAAKDSAQAAGVTIEEATERQHLRRELEKFVTSTHDRGSVEAAAVYKSASQEFLTIVLKTFADELTSEDISKHQRELRKRGLSDRTLANRHERVMAFLRYLKLDTKGLAPYKPRYEQPLPEIYTDDELRKFFASVKDHPSSVVFELLLKTGLREQEAVYLTWSSIDLNRGVLRVRSNPDHGFKVKDRGQRDIPVPADLLEKLAKYRERRPREACVRTATGRPNQCNVQQ